MKTIIKFLSFMLIVVLLNQCEKDDDKEDKIPQEGLIAYYPFNGNANDESGNGNHSTLNGPVMTNNRFENPDEAIAFDGIDDFVNLPDEVRLQPLSSYTLSFWIKTSQSNEYHLLDQRTGFGTPSSYNFGVIINQETIGEINISFPGYNSSTWDMECTCTDLNNDNWHNIVIIKNSTENKVLCYVNGNIIMDKSIEDYDYTVDGIFLIGKNYVNDRYFEGQFDDLCIYDRVLSESEIKSIYHFKGW